MKLDAWLGVLRFAARPMDVSVVTPHASRIVARATSLAMGTTSFYVAATRNGLRFTAVPPSQRAQRALERAIAEEAPNIRTTLAAEAARRLRSG